MGLQTCLLTCRLARMDAAEAAAFWLVRADSRGLSRHERAVFNIWRRDKGNGDAFQAISRTFALVGPALRDAASDSLAGSPPPSPPQAPGRPTMKLAIARALDISAIGLSALCLVHCLALPLLAVALPLLGSWARAEWVHVVFVALAAPIAVLAMVDFKVRRISSIGLAGLALTGLSWMLAGALEVPGLAWERPLTVVGGLLLATAHALNWRRVHAGHDHAL